MKNSNRVWFKLETSITTLQSLSLGGIHNALGLVQEVIDCLSSKLEPRFSANFVQFRSKFNVEMCFKTYLKIVQGSSISLFWHNTRRFWRFLWIEGDRFSVSSVSSPTLSSALLLLLLNAEPTRLRRLVGVAKL